MWWTIVIPLLALILLWLGVVPTRERLPRD
jgi:hypothetical protein